MSRSGRIEDRLARRGGWPELLRLPASLFGAVSGLRGLFYDRGWLPRARVEAPVVSVGNLTAGGTGKTPMVALLVRELARRGLRAGIVSRGYRARGSDPDEPNDEALELEALLAQGVGPVPHAQDPDRAQAAHELLPEVDVIVLDDGFQHRRLARDLDLVLVDATRPWGLPAPDEDGPRGEPVRALLPRGLLRERPEALRRADAVVLTRSDVSPAAEVDALEAELVALAPGVPVLRAAHRPARLAGFGGAEDAELAALAGRPVLLASGIGNPGAFEATVRGLGARVVEHRRFADHHGYSPDDARRLAREADEAGAWLVTTGKDAVKLGPLGCPGRALEVELELVSGSPVLAALLDALPPSRARRERAALHEGLHG